MAAHAKTRHEAVCTVLENLTDAKSFNLLICFKETEAAQINGHNYVKNSPTLTSTFANHKRRVEFVTDDKMRVLVQTMFRPIVCFLSRNN